MNITTTFRAELLKLKGTSLLKICLFAAMFMPLAVLFLDNNTPKDIASLRPDPWNIYLLESREIMGVMILPLFVILICTIIPQVEYRNNTWKQVLASPQSYSNIFFAKFMTVQLFILLLLVLNTVFMLVSVISTHQFKGDIGLWQHPLDWKQLLLVNLRFYVAALGISAIQFWVGMRFRNFIASLGIGFGVWLIGIVTLAIAQWEHAKVLPFSASMLTAFPKYQYMIPLLMWISVGYLVLFLTVGFIDFRNRRMY